MTIAIQFEGVSKRYRIGQIGTGTLSHDLHRTLAKMLGKPDPFAKIGQENTTSNTPNNEYVLALHDISININQGEVFGIIGHNGAGKSTFLKLLSQITAPTSGAIRSRGRIASLLEVGTGFHPELTGRENIYVNGAVLGMNRKEISAELERIVEFSGCSKYLDTPVKRYSSGMTTRLGFAVAAHLRCEILIIDEVLAVGDAAFQDRCIGRINEITSGGRTTVLVSHNMALMRRLANRCMLLQQGKSTCVGATADVISTYLQGSQHGESPGFRSLASHPNRLAGMKPLLQAVKLHDISGEQTSTFIQGTPIKIEINYDASKHPEQLSGIGFIVHSITGARVGGFNSYMATQPPHQIPQSGITTFTVNSPALTPGVYRLTISIGSHQSRLIDKIEPAIDFRIEPDDIYATGYLLTAEDGVVAFECDFSSTES
ncbi:ABC transporter ATP-binding protein [Rhodopirellula sallentina]|uniref:Polysaccharide ABC transporter ATP-binding protein n=1 Tax=Rhodopirellula sallentina SM41 TaxID=1263870 RepID=M5TZT7_9BACT|nr:ABC transporter ATP-binding protein [Rhodopirellula sallentina]EMI54705.1 polysaccharide ABC transporter ATP-binding protein [Rhodopirellula sallentina SM41]